MELQWPLILFTTFLSASAGLFGAQGVYAIVGRGRLVQMRALVASFVMLALGGIAVFFHLTHPDRLFNGFGHITSGITQELIAIVVMAIVMVLFFVLLRRSEEQLPAWLGVLAVVSAVALVVVMGHSYMMPSRPAWNSFVQVASLIGAACAIGAGVMAYLDASDTGDGDVHGVTTLVGSAINALASIGFVAIAAGSVGSFIQVGFYFDPNHPTSGITEAQAYSPLAADAMAYTALAIVLALCSLAFALYGKKTSKWQIAGAGCAICGFVGAMFLRVVLYCVGGSVFMFY
ncbi:MAG: hypothetical protein K6F70_00590 [Eggerthellaceae bacterium]|nr:hypothetical protein [Eggerthellaceae bacterium]